MTEFPALLPAAPEIFLVCAALGLLLFGVMRGDGSTHLVGQISVLVLVFTLILVIGHGDGREVTFSGQFVMDPFGRLMKSLVLVAATLTLIMSLGYLEREKLRRFEYPILILLATLGMLMMISANDLIALYVGLEVQSLSLYVLAAIRRDHGRSSEAGLKYFVLGALSSGLLLYGASLVYGFAGSTNFERIAAGLDTGFYGLLAADVSHAFGIVVGMVFVLAGLAFKVSAVPFHMWTPDVYEGAPTPVTAFFSAVPKVAAMALLVRVTMEPFGGLVPQWQQVLMALAVGSMVLGAFAAINQTNIKRLMAYSSIGHVGYALTGLAAGTEQGAEGVMIYLAIYLVMTVGTFAVILCMRQQGRMVEDIEQLSGLARTHPMMALVMAAFMFSLAGIPPLAGFFGKLYVFLAAVEAGLYGLAVIGVLASVVAAFYYLRIVKLMYFDDVLETLDRQTDDKMTAVLAATGLFTIGFFAFPAPVVEAASAAAAALVGG